MKTISYSPKEFLELISDHTTSIVLIINKINIYTYVYRNSFVENNFTENYFSLIELNKPNNKFIFHNPHDIEYVIDTKNHFTFKARLNDSLYAGDEFKIRIYRLNEADAEKEIKNKHGL